MSERLSPELAGLVTRLRARGKWVVTKRVPLFPQEDEEEFRSDPDDLAAADAITRLSSEREGLRHQRDLLGDVLGRCVVAAGVAEDQPLTGPELLFLGEDLIRFLGACDEPDPEPYDPTSHAFHGDEDLSCGICPGDFEDHLTYVCEDGTVRSVSDPSHVVALDHSASPSPEGTE